MKYFQVFGKNKIISIKADEYTIYSDNRLEFYIKNNRFTVTTVAIFNFENIQGFVDVTEKNRKNGRIKNE